MISDGRTAFHGRIIRVETIPREGGRGNWEVVRHPGAVAVLAIVGNRTALVRQYRPPVGSHIWEIPAGTVEPGEDLLATAQRELKEETGYFGGSWDLLCTFFTSPGISDEKITLFRAIDPKPGPSSPDEGEDLEVRLFGRLEARNLLEQGAIADAKSMVALRGYWLEEAHEG